MNTTPSARPRRITPHSHLFAATALLLSAPAFAQHAAHAHPSAADVPEPQTVPPPAPPQTHQHQHPQPEPAAATAQPATTDHAAMGHATLHPQMDHASMDHAAMDHAAMGHGDPATAAGTLPRTPIPPLDDADREAARVPATAHGFSDNAIHGYLQLDRLEAEQADPDKALAWESHGWIGTDLNRLWLRSAGDRHDGRTESASLDLLYGRSLSPWWDVVAGIRHDFKPGASQSLAAIGLQGLAPGRFEVALTAHVGERGQTLLQAEAEYELLLSNRLILQPALEVTAYGKPDASRGIGSGLNKVEAGLRLRYEITRRFAPYIGIVHERIYGGTAELHRDAGEPTHDTRFVVGLRSWF